MYVVKRDGRQETLHFNKIIARFKKLKGVTTRQLNELAAKTAAAMIGNHPDYASMNSTSFLLCGGMNGYIYISDKPVCPLEINPLGDMPMIIKNEVLSVFYKYPSFHSHIPKPPEGVTVPEKAVKKRDVLHSPILWHEKSSLLGRIVPKRPPIPKSVSGQSLAKLAYQLVCKYYLAKQPVSHGCMKVGNHGGVDVPTCQSNLKVTVCGKELDGDNENCITTESRKRKRNRGSHQGNKLGNQIGVDDPTCQSNLKATVCGKELNEAVNLHCY
ncbi:hypothetical protein CsSME_00026036 [Camellia sinensis var. sinensis]|uniref:Xrn1 helical domain-containing protein n=2 Tax=Camellia sinensis TaxID=4442 RepID=A0A4S4CZM1_CAMSN|nr:hypothetical protein TEA_023939 [Camellia sinensis var. sinensis]